MTTKQTGHPPLPLQFVKGEGVFDKDGIIFCRVSGNTDFEAEANAAFIVTACNSYYELLKILKDSIESLEFGGEPSTAIGHAIKDFQARAKKAITKAEGRE